jgi:hypothetical protein
MNFISNSLIGKTRPRPCADLQGNTLCKLFQKQARATWRLLATGRRRNWRIDEETVTNLNLLAFAGYKSKEHEITSYTKRQERRTGGDWEIWFIDRNMRGCGVRIQAKVIDLSADSFPHLHYEYPKKFGKTQSPKYQCDQLIQDCLGKPYLVSPMYCLYSTWHSSFKRQCANQSCLLVPASYIKQIRHKNELAQIWDAATPWQHLVCGECSKPNPKHSLVDTASQTLRQMVYKAFPALRAQSVEDPFWAETRQIADIGTQTELPDHVRILLTKDGPALDNFDSAPDMTTTILDRRPIT